MTSLTIKERSFRGVTIIDLAGKVTIGESNQQLHAAIKRLVLEGKNQIILNLAKVTRIDSSGLGEFVASFTTLKANGGALKLLGVSTNIIDLMTITKLYTVFEIYHTEIDAVYSFDNPDIHITQPLEERASANVEGPSSFIS